MNPKVKFQLAIFAIIIVILLEVNHHIPFEQYQTIQKSSNSARNIGELAPQVSCGMYEANSCIKCPNENGTDWCNGDCHWINGECVTRSSSKS